MTITWSPAEKERFIAALLAPAQAFAVYKAVTGSDAVLVGGAAVTFFTAGAFLSGDFDFVASQDTLMASSLYQAGFLKEDRTGRLQFGWYHPDHPAMGSSK